MARGRNLLKDDGPHPVDLYVGKKLKERRSLVGLSQTKLGEAVDLTFQQIQKYERAANRIGAGRLHDFARILNVPITFFFDGMNAKKSPVAGFSDNGQSPFGGEDLMSKKETLNLVRAYYNIRDPKLRTQMLEMIKTMAKSND